MPRTREPCGLRAYVASIKPASARPKPRSPKPTNAKQSPKNMRG